MAKRFFALVVLVMFGATIATTRADAQLPSFGRGCAVLDRTIPRDLLSDPAFGNEATVDDQGLEQRGTHSCSYTIDAGSSGTRVALLQALVRTNRIGFPRVDVGLYRRVY